MQKHGAFHLQEEIVIETIVSTNKVQQLPFY